MKFQFSKALGQNFILDENFLAGIVGKLDLNPNDTVVEIGAGAGSLTRVLAGGCKKVISYEIDKRLETILSEKLAGINNIELIFADGLKTPDKEIVKRVGGPFRLVANIPYYITTPLLMKFINIPECTEICVLVQSDVAKRIVAAPDTAEYGALSIALQARADCKIIKNVPRGIFTPAPKVDSAFVVMKKVKAQQSVDEKLLKGLFAARRKTMLNALRGTLAISADDAREILMQAEIAEHLRPENVPTQKFVELSQIVSAKNKIPQ